MKHNITLGADPEIFIKDATEIVTAEGLTEGGSKYAPKPISDLGHMIQEDGIMFEYNIPPSKTKESWIENHKFCLDYLSELAAKSNYSLANVASAEVNPIYLQTHQAKTFGCEPDFNVYLKAENEAPSSDTYLRCAGGHVAVGYGDVMEVTFETSEKIVKAFDLFVTLPSLFRDSDTRRRELYGKPGSFRIKDFGVECRALSNFWIQSEEEMGWVWDQTVIAVNTVLDGKIDDLIEEFSEEVNTCILNYDLKKAKQLIKKIEKKVLINK